MFVIAVVLGTLTALFVLLAPVIMPLFAPGFDEQLTDLTINLRSCCSRSCCCSASRAWWWES